MNALTRLGVAVTVSGLFCLPSLGQVPDGASNTYINATNAFVNVTIGTNGSFTLLTLGNNAMFTNAGSGVIGFNATARSNEVRLISPTARWFLGDQLSVGNNGSFNRLLVSNGATVRVLNGNLGLNGSGSNNLAVVTGTGSTWSNANVFYVGFNGPNNRLVISNGGTLYNSSAILGVNSSGVSNQVVVTGAGSLWSNRSDLSIGYNGVGSRLEVSNGGYVRSRVGAIGAQAGASNILVLVTGSGSTWSNAAELYVGSSGPANQMIVDEGGVVRSAVGYVGANFTASNNLALITGAGSMWSNEINLIVGSFSAHNGLMVSNGGTVVTVATGLIGPTANGNANAATITGPGSRWTVGDTFYVGSNSAFNKLLVSQSGRVSSGVSSRVGWGPSASNNLVTVTDSGSLWSNANSLYIGVNAADNQLVVSNAGVVLAAQNYTGSNIPSSNNVVTVTGPGSRMETDGAYYLGFNGSANRLHIKDGGVVRNVASHMGINPSSSNNLALVSDPGSAWTNVNQLRVGAAGPGNQLVVSNGGRVFVGEGALVGEAATSTNNRVVVDGGTLQVANPSVNGVLEIRRGTNVLNSGLIDVDRLVMTNALGWFDLNGGTLITRGAAISNTVGLWMGNLTTNPAIWAVHTGAGEHTLGAPLVVGIATPFNQLLITNGAVMRSSRYGLVGANTASVSNLVLISGTNSTWLLTDFYLGYSGNYNRLVVSNSGFLGANYTVVGGEGNTTNCEAIVTGQGSVISNSLGLQIGSSGSSNRVRVEHGGTMIGIVQVGRTAESIGNVLSVSGVGSRLDAFTNVEPISVGYDGSASRMEVSGGGAVFGYVGEIGRNLSSSNNLALVTGVGSVWSNVSDLYLGVSGAGNRLELSGGAALNNYNGFLGGNTYSSNNQAWVIGSGSSWTNRRELSVGLNGTGNQLVITNGGTVFAFANKYIGNNDGGLSNTVIVTDAGSAWLGDDSLYVGSAGSFNRLFVRNGGKVVSGLVTLGGAFGANGNQVLVSDGESVWTNQQDLTVGEYGSANTLAASNGVTLFTADGGFIGRNSGANSNTAILTGLGTRWLIRSNLYVGSNGAFGRLVVNQGAGLENREAFIGGGLSSSNNEVVITGVGSIWSNRSLFHLGVAGRGNRLEVSDGGRVESINNFEMGLNASSSNNEVIVTGPGSFCRVQNAFVLGDFSGGNRLVVSNGAWLHDDNAFIGASGTNNVAVITGPGTTWTNRSGIYVGRFRGGNRLTIADSAFVFSRDVYIGSDPTATNNFVVMNGGTLLITNSTGIGALNVLRGTNVFNAGLIDTSNLWLTNTLSWFEFNGGVLTTSGTTNSNGRVFTVGNGTDVANFRLRGGWHNFANGLAIANKGLLTGIGTVLGTVTVSPGGTLSPGTAIGLVALSNSPVLQGETVMEISRDGAVLTNDLIRVTGPLAYGGSLIVSNSGTTTLIAGDKFSLFGAASFSGNFANILLPPLTVGLQWTNKLLLDGSIEVVPYLPSPVALTIERSNGVLLVSWPTNGADYCLETTYDLSPPVTWQTVSTGFSTNNNSFVFALASSGTSPKQFFRLAYPCSQTPVTLTLQANGNLMTVSWPGNVFRLETTFSLASPVAWQPINTGITDTNGLRTFTFNKNAAVTNQFFRLASP